MSERAIGEQVFGRRDFDPRVDTIVRVQARRLRLKLNEYYEGEGSDSPLRLVLSSHPYLLSLQPAMDAPPLVRLSARSRRGFAMGLVIGAACAAVFGEGVYWPASDPWITLSDLQATQRLNALVHTAGVRFRVVDGREVGEKTVRRKSAVLIGHPKGIPWLVEVLGDLNFYLDKPRPGAHFGPLRNRRPIADELPAYLPRSANVAQGVSETEPDYALVTRRRLLSRGVLLSVFGSRARSASFLVDKLSDSEFLAALDRRIGADAWKRSRDVQLLFQIRYVNRDRMEGTLLTGRVDDQPLPGRPVAVTELAKAPEP